MDVQWCLMLVLVLQKKSRRMETLVNREPLIEMERKLKAAISPTTVDELI